MEEEKELEIAKESTADELNAQKKSASSKDIGSARNLGGRRRIRDIFRIKTTAPTSASCELPILAVLSRSAEKGMRALIVVREVASSVWFPELTEDDREACYNRSRKKIVSSVIRWARQNLVMKGELYLPGDGECKAGVWKATAKGLARAKDHGGDWAARYKAHDGIIIIRD
ncbi:MAG: hypothetical protein ACHQ1H_04680 [Nitrososphaerales archaeon]